MIRTALLALALLVPSGAIASGTGTARTCLFEGSPQVIRIYMGIQGDAVAVINEREIELVASGSTNVTAFTDTEGVPMAVIDNGTTWAMGWFHGTLAEGTCEFGATQ
jgi:hypothetical protein